MQEPTANLKKVEEFMSVMIPNAVTMEKSSCDTIDSNCMLCNAFEQVKSKIRATETGDAKENESFFVQLARGKHEENSNRRKHLNQK